jgi:hypothetical protein
MSMAYRGLDHVADARFEELAARRMEEIKELATARRVYARRVARVVGGGVGTLGAVVVFLAAIGAMIASPSFLNTSHFDGALTYGLFGCWVAALVAYVIARVNAAFYIGAVLARPLVREGDAVHDLARLETLAPARVLERRAMPLEGWSAALPLTCLSFLMPLTLHYVVGQLLNSGPGHGLGAKDYDQWIGVSVAIVGHAHLVLAICALHFGLKLARRDTPDIAHNTSGWLKAYGFTVLAGAIPGALFFLIPPLFVALTGIVFIPFMFIGMSNRIVGERRVLDAA